MFLNWWFTGLVALAILNLGIALAKHGEPKEEKYSFWTTLIASIISVGVTYMAVTVGVN